MHYTVTVEKYPEILLCIEILQIENRRNGTNSFMEIHKLQCV